MIIDISSLSRMHEFDLETKSLGQVQCRSLNDKMNTNLTKALTMPDGDGLNFARKVLSMVSKKTVIRDGREDSQDQKEEGCTDEEISKITEAEVEIFAQEFIAHNRWLLCSHKDGGRQARINKEEIVSPTPITTDLPKGNDEKSTNYLVRLYRQYFEEQSKLLKKLTRTETAKNINYLGRGTLAEIMRYQAENSATGVIERLMKRDQDLMRAINPYVEENEARATIAIQRKIEQDLLRTASSSLEIEKRCLAETSASVMMAKEIYLSEALIRETALGYAQEATLSSVIGTEMKKQQQEFHNLLKSHEAMFRLPQAAEATHLLESYQVGAVAEFAQQHAIDILDRQHSLEAITAPWLHRGEESRSVMAILELQGMGNALRTVQGFDPELTVALRLDLGDWRDKITFPESVFIDAVARTDFYIKRGFKSELTDFPYAAFHQSLDLAGLDDTSLDLELYGSVTPRSVDPEEAGLQRTNKCHDRLQRFERLLRQFIDKEMTAQYGPNWPKKRLAPKLYQAWKSKKEKADRKGEAFTFIEWADFTDYERIICKQDHWQEVFETIFKKNESVRESLQRLQPVRLAVAHSRIVTKDDELYFAVEIKRLLSAIK